jgi:hypothetical protein
MVLELSSPSMEDTGEAGQVGADKALLLGEALEGLRKGMEQGPVGNALMRADKRTQGLRDGEGDEEVRPGELVFEVLMEPLPGFMVLALRAVAIAA